MDGFVAWRGLIEPQRLRALNARSDFRGALQLASHVTAITASGLALHLAWNT